MQERTHFPDPKYQETSDKRFEFRYNWPLTQHDLKHKLPLNYYTAIN